MPADPVGDAAGGSDVFGDPTINIEPVGPVIPTISQWGLVVMTLLLLTGATTIFAPRRAGKSANPSRTGKA